MCFTAELEHLVYSVLLIGIFNMETEMHTRVCCRCSRDLGCLSLLKIAASFCPNVTLNVPATPRQTGKLSVVFIIAVTLFH